MLPFSFAMLAGVSRLLLPTTESRVQIAAFVAAAIAFELIGKPAAGLPPSGRSLLANAGAVIASVITVKWWLEGISLDHWLRIAALMLGRL